MPVTGLATAGEMGNRTMTWEQPPTREVELPGTTLRIWPGMESKRGPYEPAWDMRTSLTLGVAPEEPLTVNEAMARYGTTPLLAFMAFAGDQPDAVVYESLYDPDQRRGARVVRSGPEIAERAWRPYAWRLFAADEVPDLDRALWRWFELWELTVPGLAFLNEAIMLGNRYDVSRFLFTWTAGEIYWKRTKPAQSRQPWGIDALHERAAIPDDLTGCDSDARALIGATRGHTMHGSTGAYRSSEIFDEMFESTRRLHVLLQACLLRELGFSDGDIERVLREHYRNWPLT